MKKNLSILFLVIFSIINTACSTQAKTYQISSLNNAKMMQLHKKINVQLSPSSINDTSVSSRLSSISMPNNDRIDEYIKNAFNGELRYAKVYSLNKDAVVLTLELQDVELYTRFGNASWNFKIKISSNNNESFTLRTQYPFESLHSSEFDGYPAASAFKPVVQELILDIIYDKEFINLLK